MTVGQGAPAVAGKSEDPEDFITVGRPPWLVPARSPDALASIIAGVLGDPAKAAASGEAGCAAGHEPSREPSEKLAPGAHQNALAAAR